MTPRVKIISLWVGALPPWTSKFLERIKANSDVIDFELIQLSVAAIRVICEQRTGYVCGKTTGYAMCDLRPAFGDMFASRFRKYEFFGWCDLDVCFGHLSSFLDNETLDAYDVISGASYCVDGPFTIIRNRAAFVDLYRCEEFQQVASSPTYHNFDEKGFTQIVRAHSWYLFGDWSSHDRHTVPRRCELNNDRLWEVPGNRHIAYYHFPGKKQWPL